MHFLDDTYLHALDDFIMYHCILLRASSACDNGLSSEVDAS